MRRVFLLFCMLTLLAATLAGCAAGAVQNEFPGYDGGETNFNATILEISGDSVLVEPMTGDPIRASSDRITFSTEELDLISVQPGDTVTVTYTGGVAESYPAQVRAVSWSRLEYSGSTDANPRATSNGAVTVSCGAEDVAGISDVYMAIPLPAGWVSEVIPYSPAATGNDGCTADFGIQFWPEDAPELIFFLKYIPDGIGICGTGVTFTAMTFANGLSGTACTENNWFLLIYDAPRNFAVECIADPALQTEYADDLLRILDGAVLLG